MQVTNVQNCTCSATLSSFSFYFYFYFFKQLEIITSGLNEQQWQTNSSLMLLLVPSFVRVITPACWGDVWDKASSWCQRSGFYAPSWISVASKYETSLYSPFESYRVVFFFPLHYFLFCNNLGGSGDANFFFLLEVGGMHTHSYFAFSQLES